MTDLARRTRAELADDVVSDGYKWTALFVSTLGLLMATIDGSIVLIALPGIEIFSEDDRIFYFRRVRRAARER